MMPSPLAFALLSLLTTLLVAPGAISASEHPANAGIQTMDQARSQAMQRMFEIEASRGDPESLRLFLGSSDDQIRRRATRTLGRIRSQESLPLMEKMLEDPEIAVRRQGAISLQDLAGATPIVRKALSSERDPLVRTALLETLGKIGDSSDLERFLKVLALESDSALQTAAAESIGRLGARKAEGVAREEVLVALLAGLRGVLLEPRRASAFALARVEARELSQPLQEQLLNAIQDEPDRFSKAFLVRAAAAGLDDTRWSKVVESLVRSSDPGVRIALARGLAKRASAPASALLLLAADPERPVRLTALEACASLGSQPEIDAMLHRISVHGDAEERGLALSALLERGLLESPKAWLAPDVPILTRVMLVGAMKDRVLLLKIAFDEENAPLRTTAVEALLGLEPSPEILLRLLDHPDPVLASAAASTLAEKPEIKAEIELLSRLAGATERDLVIAVLQALNARYSGEKPAIPRPRPEASARVAELSRSADPGIRAAILSLLKPLKLPSPPAPPAPPPLSLDEILQIQAARIETDRGFFVIALEPDEAPLAVESFARLAERGFYDGLSFHRVVPDFVVQGGDPRGDGWGGPGYALPDEFSALPFRTWAVGMASSGPDTAGSQWFVTLSPQPHLDGRYTRFGVVSVGREVVRGVQRGDTIRKITIERSSRQKPAPPESK